MKSPSRKFAHAGQIFSFFLRAALAAAIIGWMAVKYHASIAEALRDLDYRWLPPAVLLYAFHLIVCAWRWRNLAEVLQIHLSAGEALALTMQGNFFSLVIPGGAIGGDVAKAGILMKRSKPGTRFEGTFSILMDRMTGMVALFLPTLAVAVAALPLLLQVTLPGQTASGVARYLLPAGVFGLCLAGLGGAVLIFFHRAFRKIRLCDRLMNYGDRLSHGLVSRLTEATDAYARRWRLLAGMTLAGVVFVHGIQIPIVLCLIRALGMSCEDFTGVCAAVLIGNLAGLLPCTLSGIGLRDVTICAILTVSGVAHPAAVPLLLTVLIVLFNLAGGVFFIFSPRRSPSIQTCTHEAKL